MMDQFVWFDIITLGLILILAIKGVMNGFIKEVFGLVGIVGGIYFAFRFAEKIGTWISINFYALENESILFIVGFLAILLAFWISSILLGNIFAKMISISGLRGIDAIGGFLVGGAKIFFVFSVLFLLLSNIAFVKEKLDQYLHNSLMYPAFLKTGAFIANMKTSDFVKAKKINIDTNESTPESSDVADQNHEANGSIQEATENKNQKDEL
ncbi:MAG: colicin V synthesis protein [Proteobacteria bacterium]|nr:MAG: colicin V synthesis protein [Pseudomonadota bacterium]